MTELLDADAELLEALGPYLPAMRFLLDDVGAVNLDLLMARPVTPATRLMLVSQWLVSHNKSNESAAARSSEWLELLQLVADGPNGQEDLVAVLTYSCTVGILAKSDLIPLVDQLGPEVKETAVNLVEAWRAEGEAQGRVKALIELVELKFGPQPQSVIETVRAAESDPEQLRIWQARVLDAKTVEGVFGR